MVTFKKDIAYYSGVDPDVLEMVPAGSDWVLDVGCGTGALGKKLKEEKRVKQVIGIELMPEIAREASNSLDRIFRIDAELARLDAMHKHFDCIIMSGILHHLKDPWTVVKRFRNYLKDDGCIVAAIPNVGHISVLKNLLQGKWQYSESGVLDVCHMKFFTLESIISMFAEADFKIDAIKEQISDYTPQNQDFIKRMASSVEVGPNFLRDSFVLQFVTRWKKT